MSGSRRRLAAFGVALLFVVLYLGFFLRRITNPHRGFDPDPETRAVVKTVFDGDTVKVEFDDRTEKSVRLIGVDCPEIDDDREGVRFQALMVGQDRSQQVTVIPGGGPSSEGRWSAPARTGLLSMGWPSPRPASVPLRGDVVVFLWSRARN